LRVDEPWQRKLLSCCIYRHSSWRRLRIETVRAGMRASERGKCRNRETETSGRGLGKYNSNTWDDSARRWYPPPFELKSRSISVACYRRRMCTQTHPGPPIKRSRIMSISLKRQILCRLPVSLTCLSMVGGWCRGSSNRHVVS
jgi:hypothetical protein